MRLIIKGKVYRLNSKNERKVMKRLFREYPDHNTLVECWNDKKTELYETVPLNVIFNESIDRI